MKGIIRQLLIVCTFLGSASLYAQDVTGDYTLNVSQDPGASDCVWEGDLSLIQSGGNPGTFTGSASLSPVSGPCPGFSGTVSGTINGSALEIGVAVGGLGNATFSGTVVGPNDLAGTWSGLGFTGIWSAVRDVVRNNATEVPTLTQWSLLLLVALVVGFALRNLRVRKA